MPAWTHEPPRLNRIPFGKHRGKPWAEPPDDCPRRMAGQGGSGQGDMDAEVVADARQELDRRAVGVIGALANAADAG